MKITVFAICYNEELILPYFIRHYSQFADICLYDNYSTDKSEEIATMAGVKTIKYDSNNEIRDDIYLQIKNSCWKSSKADWVIVCDVDEFVYHPNLANILEKADSTIFSLNMFNMISFKFPTTNGQIYEEVNMGVPALPPFKTKMVLFKPQEISEINYGPGCHNAFPVGNVKLNMNSDIKILHMKLLSKEYIINKNIMYGKRLSEINKRMGWGKGYLRSQKEIGDMFDSEFKKTIKII
jgi:glycosyltransferase involved in cell wall biosynthesis